MLSIKVTKKPVEHGLQLGKKVYVEKLSNSKICNAKSLQADIYGFIAQSIVCDYFKKELPNFEENNDYDLIIKNKRIDVKKVGYNNNDKRIMILINKRQYERKQGKIDYFMFVTFSGTFQQILVNDYQLFIPMPEMSNLNILGYINIKDIEKNSKVYKFYKGNSICDEAYLLDIASLSPKI
jgi:hypothetical protein